MAAWADRYLRHFTHYFQKPFDVQVYRRDDGVDLRLATFDRGYPKYKIYASLGLSDQAHRLKDRGEIILLSDDPGKDIPFLFVNALFFILDRNIPLGSRFAIGGIDAVKPDFAEYFDKHAIYFTLADGFPPGLERVEMGGEIGTVFQGLFVSWSEQDYLNRNGGAALEERLKAQAADPCSLRRPPCV